MTYMEEVMRTFQDQESDFRDELMCIAGLVGESGEIVDWAKKNMFHKIKPNPMKLALELGDLLWYIEAYKHIRSLPCSTIYNIEIHDTLLKGKPINSFPVANYILRVAFGLVEYAIMLIDYPPIDVVLDNLNFMRIDVGYIAKHLNFSLETIERMNIEKLTDRYSLLNQEI